MSSVRSFAAALSLVLAIPHAQAAPVSIPVPDSAPLSGDHTGAGTSGVVLIHDDARSKLDWKDLSKRLASRGYQLLSVDLRGHGDTPGTLTDDSYAPMATDIAHAIAFLKAQGASSISLVGAGFGGNLALHVAAEHPEVMGVGMLSPRLSAHGYRSTTSVAIYGDRPLFLAGGEGDQSTARAISSLQARAGGDVTVEFLSSSASGAALLNVSSRLESALASWLHEVYKTSAPTLPQAKRGGAVLQDGNMSTTGRRFGEE